MLSEGFILKVSFTGAPEYMDRNVGYGEASYHIFQEFEKQGIECLIGSPQAKIGISFVQPDKYRFGKNQYKIGYTPWESTDVFDSWRAPLRNGIDEMWTTSPWCAEIFKQHTDKPVFVYEHGIEDTWIPLKRKLSPDRPFRFLHVGEPAFRKDAQMVVDAFIKTFGHDPNYELVLKCSQMNTTRVYDELTGRVKGSPNAFYKNIKIIESFISVEQMNGLYDLCDAFVYPSWGEGFGFNPLQAMAKGIPTICTSGWASYARYITMPLDSTWNMSPWTTTHPGQLLKPDFDQLKKYMKDVVDDYEYYSSLAYKNSFLIHKDYSWKKVTQPAFQRLTEIQENL
jgi:glycosyltransferase involved in cell wall biosynthesis